MVGHKFEEFAESVQIRYYLFNCALYMLVQLKKSERVVEAHEDEGALPSASTIRTANRDPHYLLFSFFEFLPSFLI